ncbi:Rhodanese domain protein [Haliangium ochraceum DSM 14365]|uniref:Rhodanese domain protein n=1 Tax=Haliangium ochraceum (strain DSM 14365 / JCM 11303 / SMP-2) TaxID=502025 RepID=D0LMD3_HALO1|nr:Rhodanese domain protein [Haliangium ochraceum DSM 14365]
MVGLDQSDEAIQAGRRLIDSLGVSDIELKVGSAEQLAFDDDTFDTVFCQLGLDVCAEPASVLREVVRVLKPGGRLAMLTLGSREKNQFLTLPYDALRAADRPVPSLDAHFQIRTATNLESLMQVAGLVDARCQTVGIMLDIANSKSLWDVAASVTGWSPDEYEHVREGLDRACATVASGAKVSMEMLLSLAVKPIDPSEAARPRSFDSLVATTRSRIREVTPFEARRNARENDVVFLDVREEDELDAGTLPKAMHLPRGLLEIQASQQLPNPERSIIVYSASGRRSALAALRLQELGYKNVWSLYGGFRAWQGNAYPVEPRVG